MINSIFPKYFRCNKCGQHITKVENYTQLNGMCTGSVTYRTSGICGGSFTNEMTEEQYNAQLKEWEEARNKKII
jgi:hypothetical protein